MSQRMYHPCHKLSVPSAKLFWCRHCMQMFEDAISRWKHSKICRFNSGIKQKDQDGQVVQMYVKPDTVSYTQNSLPGQTVIHKPQYKKKTAELKCVICSTKFFSLYDMREHVKYPCQKLYSSIGADCSESDSDVKEDSVNYKIRRVEIDNTDSVINSGTALSVLAEASKHVESLSHQRSFVRQVTEAGIEQIERCLQTDPGVGEVVRIAGDYADTILLDQHSAPLQHKQRETGSFRPVARRDIEPVSIVIQAEDGEDLPEDALGDDSIIHYLKDAVQSFEVGQTLQVQIRHETVKHFIVGPQGTIYPDNQLYTIHPFNNTVTISEEDISQIPQVQGTSQTHTKQGTRQTHQLQGSNQTHQVQGLRQIHIEQGTSQTHQEQGTSHIQTAEGSSQTSTQTVSAEARTTATEADSSLLLAFLTEYNNTRGTKNSTPITNIHNIQSEKQRVVSSGAHHPVSLAPHLNSEDILSQSIKQENIANVTEHSYQLPCSGTTQSEGALNTLSQRSDQANQTKIDTLNCKENFTDIGSQNIVSLEHKDVAEGRISLGTHNSTAPVNVSHQSIQNSGLPLVVVNEVDTEVRQAGDIHNNVVFTYAASIMAEEQPLLASSLNLFGFEELTGDLGVSANSSSTVQIAKSIHLKTEEKQTNYHSIDENEVIVPILSEKSGIKKYKVLARQQAEEDEIPEVQNMTVSNVRRPIARDSINNVKTKTVDCLKRGKNYHQAKGTHIKSKDASTSLKKGMNSNTGKSELAIGVDGECQVITRPTTPVSTEKKALSFEGHGTTFHARKTFYDKKENIATCSKDNTFEKNGAQRLQSGIGKLKNVKSRLENRHSKTADKQRIGPKVSKVILNSSVHLNQEEIQTKKVKDNYHKCVDTNTKVKVSQEVKVDNRIEKKYATQPDMCNSVLVAKPHISTTLSENALRESETNEGETCQSQEEDSLSKNVHQIKAHERSLSIKTSESDNFRRSDAGLTSFRNTEVSRCLVSLIRDPSIDSFHKHISDSSSKSTVSKPVSFKRKLSDPGHIKEDKTHLVARQNSDIGNSSDGFQYPFSFKRQKSSEDKLKQDMVFNADIDVRKSGRLQSAKCASRYRGDYGIRAETYSKITSKKTEDFDDWPLNMKNEARSKIFEESNEHNKGDSVDGLVKDDVDSEYTNVIEIINSNKNVSSHSIKNHRKIKKFIDGTANLPKQVRNDIRSAEIEGVPGDNIRLSTVSFDVDCFNEERYNPSNTSPSVKKQMVNHIVENSSSSNFVCTSEHCFQSVNECSMDCSMSESSGILATDSHVPSHPIPLLGNDTNNRDIQPVLNTNGNCAQNTVAKELELHRMDQTTSISCECSETCPNYVGAISVSSKTGYVHSVGKSVNKKQNYITKRKNTALYKPETPLLSPDSSSEKCDPSQVLENLRHKLFERVGLNAQVTSGKPKHFESKLISSKLKRSMSSLGCNSERGNQVLEQDNDMSSSCDTTSLQNQPRCLTTSNEPSNDVKILEEISEKLNSMHMTKRKFEGKVSKPKSKRQRFEDKKFMLRSMAKVNDKSLFDDRRQGVEQKYPVQLSQSWTANEIDQECMQRSLETIVNCKHSNDAGVIGNDGQLNETIGEIQEAAQETRNKPEVKAKKKKPKTVKCQSCCQTFKSKELMLKHYPCRVRQTRTWSQNKLRPNRAFKSIPVPRKRIGFEPNKSCKPNNNKSRPQLLKPRKTKFKPVKGKRRRRMRQMIQELMNKRSIIEWPHLNVDFTDLSFKEQCFYRLGLSCVGSKSEGLENYTGEDLNLFKEHQEKERAFYLSRNFKHIFPPSDDESVSSKSDATVSNYVPKTCDDPPVPCEILKELDDESINHDKEGNVKCNDENIKHLVEIPNHSDLPNESSFTKFEYANGKESHTALEIQSTVNETMEYILNSVVGFNSDMKKNSEPDIALSIKTLEMDEDVYSYENGKTEILNSSDCPDDSVNDIDVKGESEIPNVKNEDGTDSETTSENTVGNFGTSFESLAIEDKSDISNIVNVPNIQIETKFIEVEVYNPKTLRELASSIQSNLDCRFACTKPPDKINTGLKNDTTEKCCDRQDWSVSDDLKYFGSYSSVSAKGTESEVPNKTIKEDCIGHFQGIKNQAVTSENERQDSNEIECAGLQDQPSTGGKLQDQVTTCEQIKKCVSRPLSPKELNKKNSTFENVMGKKSDLNEIETTQSTDVTSPSNDMDFATDRINQPYNLPLIKVSRENHAETAEDIERMICDVNGEKREDDSHCNIDLVDTDELVLTKVNQHVINQPLVACSSNSSEQDFLHSIRENVMEADNQWNTVESRAALSDSKTNFGLDVGKGNESMFKANGIFEIENNQFQSNSSSSIELNHKNENKMEHVDRCDNLEHTQTELSMDKLVKESAERSPASKSFLLDRHISISNEKDYSKDPDKDMPKTLDDLTSGNLCNLKVDVETDEYSENQHCEDKEQVPSARELGSFDKELSLQNVEIYCPENDAHLCSSPISDNVSTKAQAVIKYKISGVYIKENLETGQKEVIPDEFCETDNGFRKRQFSVDEGSANTSDDSFGPNQSDEESPCLKSKTSMKECEVMYTESMQKERHTIVLGEIETNLQSETDHTAKISSNGSDINDTFKDSETIDFGNDIQKQDEIEVMRYADDSRSPRKKSYTEGLSVCEIQDANYHSFKTEQTLLPGLLGALDKPTDDAFVSKIEVPPVLDKEDWMPDILDEEVFSEDSQLSSNGPPLLEPVKKPRGERHFLDVLGEICEAKNTDNQIKSQNKPQMKDSGNESCFNQVSTEIENKLGANNSIKEDIGRHFSDVIDSVSPSDCSEMHMLLDKSERGDVTLAQIKSLLKPETKHDCQIPMDKLLKIRAGVEKIMSKVKFPQKRDPAWLKRNELFHLNEEDMLYQSENISSLRKENIFEKGDNIACNVEEQPAKESSLDDNLKLKGGCDSSTGSITDNILQMLTSLEDKGSFAVNITNLLDILAENLGFLRGNTVPIDEVVSQSENEQAELDDHHYDDELDEEEPPSLDDIPIADEFYMLSNIESKSGCQMPPDNDLSDMPNISNALVKSSPIYKEGQMKSEEESSNVSMNSEMTVKGDKVLSYTDHESRLMTGKNIFHNEVVKVSHENTFKAQTLFKSITELNSIETDDDSDSKDAFDAISMSQRMSELKSLGKDAAVSDADSDISSGTESEAGKGMHPEELVEDHNSINCSDTDTFLNSKLQDSVGVHLDDLCTVETNSCLFPVSKDVNIDMSASSAVNSIDEAKTFLLNETVYNKSVNSLKEDIFEDEIVTTVEDSKQPEISTNALTPIFDNIQCVNDLSGISNSVIDNDADENSVSIGKDIEVNTNTENEDVGCEPCDLVRGNESGVVSFVNTIEHTDDGKLIELKDTHQEALFNLDGNHKGNQDENGSCMQTEKQKPFDKDTESDQTCISSCIFDHSNHKSVEREVSISEEEQQTYDDSFDDVIKDASMTYSDSEDQIQKIVGNETTGVSVTESKNDSYGSTDDSLQVSEMLVSNEQLNHAAGATVFPSVKTGCTDCKSESSLVELDEPLKESSEVINKPLDSQIDVLDTNDIVSEECHGDLDEGIDTQTEPILEINDDPRISADALSGIAKSLTLKAKEDMHRESTVTRLIDPGATGSNSESPLDEINKSSKSLQQNANVDKQLECQTDDLETSCIVEECENSNNDRKYADRQTPSLLQGENDLNIPKDEPRFIADSHISKEQEKISAESITAPFIKPHGTDILKEHENLPEELTTASILKHQGSDGYSESPPTEENKSLKENTDIADKSEDVSAEVPDSENVFSIKRCDDALVNGVDIHTAVFLETTNYPNLSTDDKPFIADSVNKVAHTRLSDGSTITSCLQARCVDLVQESSDELNKSDKSVKQTTKVIDDELYISAGSHESENNVNVWQCADLLDDINSTERQTTDTPDFKLDLRLSTNGAPLVADGHIKEQEMVEDVTTTVPFIKPGELEINSKDTLEDFDKSNKTVHLKPEFVDDSLDVSIEENDLPKDVAGEGHCESNDDRNSLNDTLQEAESIISADHIRVPDKSTISPLLKPGCSDDDPESSLDNYVQSDKMFKQKTEVLGEPFDVSTTKVLESEKRAFENQDDVYLDDGNDADSQTMDMQEGNNYPNISIDSTPYVADHLIFKEIQELSGELTSSVFIKYESTNGDTKPSLDYSNKSCRSSKEKINYENEPELESCERLSKDNVGADSLKMEHEVYVLQDDESCIEDVVLHTDLNIDSFDKDDTLNQDHCQKERRKIISSNSGPEVQSECDRAFVNAADHVFPVRLSLSIDNLEKEFDVGNNESDLDEVGVSSLEGKHKVEILVDDNIEANESDFEEYKLDKSLLNKEEYDVIESEAIIQGNSLATLPAGQIVKSVCPVSRLETELTNDIEQDGTEHVKFYQNPNFFEHPGLIGEKVSGDQTNTEILEFDLDYEIYENDMDESDDDHEGDNQAEIESDLNNAPDEVNSELSNEDIISTPLNNLTSGDPEHTPDGENLDENPCMQSISTTEVVSEVSEVYPINLYVDGPGEYTPIGNARKPEVECSEELKMDVAEPFQKSQIASDIESTNMKVEITKEVWISSETGGKLDDNLSMELDKTSELSDKYSFSPNSDCEDISKSVHEILETIEEKLRDNIEITPSQNKIEHVHSKESLSQKSTCHNTNERGVWTSLSDKDIPNRKDSCQITNDDNRENLTSSSISCVDEDSGNTVVYNTKEQGDQTNSKEEVIEEMLNLNKMNNDLCSGEFCETIAEKVKRKQKERILKMERSRNQFGNLNKQPQKTKDKQKQFSIFRSTMLQKKAERVRQKSIEAIASKEIMETRERSASLPKDMFGAPSSKAIEETKVKENVVKPCFVKLERLDKKTIDNYKKVTVHKETRPPIRFKINLKQLCVKPCSPRPAHFSDTISGKSSTEDESEFSDECSEENSPRSLASDNWKQSGANRIYEIKNSPRTFHRGLEEGEPIRIRVKSIQPNVSPTPFPGIVDQAPVSTDTDDRISPGLIYSEHEFTETRQEVTNTIHKNACSLNPMWVKDLQLSESDTTDLDSDSEQVINQISKSISKTGDKQSLDNNVMVGTNDSTYDYSTNVADRDNTKKAATIEQSEGKSQTIKNNSKEKPSKEVADKPLSKESAKGSENILRYNSDRPSNYPIDISENLLIGYELLEGTNIIDKHDNGTEPESFSILKQGDSSDVKQDCLTKSEVTGCGIGTGAVSTEVTNQFDEVHTRLTPCEVVASGEYNADKEGNGYCIETDNANAVKYLENEVFTGKLLSNEAVEGDNEIMYYAVEMNDDFETNLAISNLEELPVEEVCLEPEQVTVVNTEGVETNIIESMAYEIQQDYDFDNVVELEESNQIHDHEMITVNDVESCTSEMTGVSCVAVTEKRNRFVYGVDEDSQTSQEVIEECVMDCTDEIQI